jgi:hypothetical protein
MTRNELDAIEARAHKATAGPWRAALVGRLYDRWVIEPDRLAECAFGLRKQQDAAFIAAARTDVPALVAEVRRLTALVEAACDLGVAALSARRVCCCSGEPIMGARCSAGDDGRATEGG